MKLLSLTLGQYKTCDAYLEAIKKTRIVSSYAESIAKEMSISKKNKKVQIALLTFSDLGLSGIQTTQQIKDAAVAKEYGLPDVEVALALALQEQEVGDWWITLHDPIKDSDGGPGVLCAGRRGEGRWLYAYWGTSGDRWDDDGAFAFLVPASLSSGLEHSEKPLDSLPLELTINGFTYRRV